MTNVSTNWLRDELLAALVRLWREGRMRAAGVVEIRLGGGSARSRSASAANGHSRRDHYLVTLAGFDIAHDELRAALAAWTTGAVYLDRTDPAERAARTRDAFAADQWARLAAVKAALDPAGRFRHGLPIS
jgi:hypothetical protein